MKYAVVIGNGSDWTKYQLTFHSKVKVFRVNSFFFENKYYFGRRIDFLQVGGDPYIKDYYLSTLNSKLADNHYDLLRWQSTSERYHTFGRELEFLRDKIDLTNNHLSSSSSKKKHSSGVIAIQRAINEGFEKVLCINFDLYKKQGYPFTLEGWAKSVLHEERGASMNERLHDYDADAGLIEKYEKLGLLIRITPANIQQVNARFPFCRFESRLQTIANTTDWYTPPNVSTTQRFCVKFYRFVKVKVASKLHSIEIKAASFFSTLRR